MVWAILSSLCDAISSISWKRSLLIAPDLLGLIHRIFGILLGSIPIMLVLWALGYGIDDSAWQGKVFVMTVIYAILQTLINPIQQRVYREEKISVIAPYEKIRSVLVLVFGFFLFGNVSVVTFMISLATVACIMGFSWNARSGGFPRSFPLMLTIEGLATVSILLMPSILLLMTSTSFFIVKNCLFILILFLWLIPSLGIAYRQVRGLNRTFFFHRFVSAFIGNISDVINLFIMASFGIIIAVLLSFISTVVSIVLSFVFLGEHPTRRELISVVVVTIFVAAGMYFR